MYIDQEDRIKGNAVEMNSNNLVIARFEAWLRSHGYEPRRDPFVPPGAGYDLSDSAADLVGEYLEDRPGERGNRDILMGHALQIGEVCAFWGDSGCGLAGVRY
jgi:hypothetical protein